MHHLEQRARARLGDLLRRALLDQPVHHVAEHRLPGKQREFLEHRPAIRPRPGHGRALDAHRAVARRHEAAHDVEKRRLAAAGRPEDRDELALGDIERNVAQRQMARAASGLECLRQPLDEDHSGQDFVISQSQQEHSHRPRLQANSGDTEASRGDGSACARHTAPGRHNSGAKPRTLGGSHGSHPSRRDVLKTGSALALGALGARAPSPATMTRAREGTLRPRQKRRRGHLVHGAFQRHDRAGARPRFRGGVSGHQGERGAHHRAGRLSAAHAGAARRRHAGRRVLVDRHRPLRGAEGEEACSRNTCPTTRAKVIDVYKNYDPDGYYTVTSAGLIAISYNTAKLKEADAPKNWSDLARSEMEGQDRARPPRLLAAMSAPGW